MIQKKGFTLIELLIVVAIIGILAAIAIPNFLNAQVRAKVARAVADIQSCTTGIETYHVDYNQYPFDGGNCSPGPYWYLPDSLTTPITYVSSTAMGDPFRDEYYGSTAFGGPSWIYERYRYQNIDDTWGGMGPDCSTASSYYPTMLCVAGHYAVQSAGPDRYYGPTGYWKAAQECGYPAWPIPYDPTNGTLSDGQIMRTQKEASYK